MVTVKICGITNTADAVAAARAGADALGFIFAPSPRQVTPEQARSIIRELPDSVLTVGVFVNEDPERTLEIKTRCGLDLLQLHGDESEEIARALGNGIIKALRVRDDKPPSCAEFPGTTLLLDTYREGVYGGAGKAFKWDAAVEIARARPIILAGGLEPDNITQAVTTVRPFGVDVSTGVEYEPGRKDHDRVARFITRAKNAADYA